MTQKIFFHLLHDKLLYYLFLGVTIWITRFMAHCLEKIALQDMHSSYGTLKPAGKKWANLAKPGYTGRGKTE